MVFVDSDLLIKCLRSKKNPINKKAQQVLKDLFVTNSELKITIYNYAELYRGAFLSKKVAYNLDLIEKFLSKFIIIFPTLKSMKEYARISANLQLKGISIGDFDELIASIVINEDDILVTRNIKHYERIPLLSLQNWEKTSTINDDN
ncbi:MAG: type II toxin-antitoxin system VapC family toxin [Promethearchaeota archaeon]